MSIWIRTEILSSTQYTIKRVDSRTLLAMLAMTEVVPSLAWLKKKDSFPITPKLTTTRKWQGGHGVVHCSSSLESRCSHSQCSKISVSCTIHRNRTQVEAVFGFVNIHLATQEAREHHAFSRAVKSGVTIQYHHVCRRCGYTIDGRENGYCRLWHSPNAAIYPCWSDIARAIFLRGLLGARQTLRPSNISHGGRQENGCRTIHFISPIFGGTFWPHGHSRTTP